MRNSNDNRRTQFAISTLALTIALVDSLLTAPYVMAQKNSPAPQEIKNDSGGMFMEEVGSSSPPPASRPPITVDVSRLGIPVDPSGNIIPVRDANSGPVRPIGSVTQSYYESPAQFMPAFGPNFGIGVGAGYAPAYPRPFGYSPGAYSPYGYSRFGSSPFGYSPFGYSPNGYSRYGYPPNGSSPFGYSPFGYSPGFVNPYGNSYGNAYGSRYAYPYGYNGAQSTGWLGQLSSAFNSNRNYGPYQPSPFNYYGQPAPGMFGSPYAGRPFFGLFTPSISQYQYTSTTQPLF